MDMSELIKKLKELHKNIEAYAKYLEDYTYHPYREINEFATELQEIINDIEN